MKRYLNTNTKLKKDGIVKFSLAAQKTCPQAGKCKAGCFGIQGAYLTYAKVISKAHNDNYEFSKRQYFHILIAKEIERYNIKIVRIHDTGDFYNQEYLSKWTAVAFYCSTARFYAYTKSLHLDFTDFEKLPNVKLIRSYGGKLDDKIDDKLPHSRVFENVVPDDYIDCTDSDLRALETVNPRIGFVYHGAKSKSFSS